MKKEKQSLFEKGLAATTRRLTRVQDQLDMTKSLWDAKDMPGSYEASFELAEASEKLTLMARVLPAYTGHPMAMKELDRRLAENMPIRMGFTPEGWFCLVIPALLPKKKNSSPAYMRDMLYPAMSRFFRGKPPVRYTNCAMVFRHVYDKARPERRCRDHDNIEVSAVVNVLAHFLLHDDDGLSCPHYYFSSVGDTDQTEVLLIPEEDFWTKQHVVKNREKREVILLETLP